MNQAASQPAPTDARPKAIDQLDCFDGGFLRAANPEPDLRAVALRLTAVTAARHQRLRRTVSDVEELLA